MGQGLGEKSWREFHSWFLKICKLALKPHDLVKSEDGWLPVKSDRCFQCRPFCLLIGVTGNYQTPIPQSFHPGAHLPSWKLCLHLNIPQWTFYALFNFEKDLLTFFQNIHLLPHHNLSMGHHQEYRKYLCSS